MNGYVRDKQLVPGRRSKRNSAQRKKMAVNVFRVHGSLCLYCRNKADTIDHVVPLNLGGYDIFENIVPACKECNGSKHGMSIEQWIETGKAPTFDIMTITQALIDARIDMIRRLERGGNG